MACMSCYFFSLGDHRYNQRNLFWEGRNFSIGIPKQMSPPPFHFPDLPFRFPFLTSNDIVLCTLLYAVYTMFTNQSKKWF